MIDSSAAYNSIRQPRFRTTASSWQLQVLVNFDCMSDYCCDSFGFHCLLSLSILRTATLVTLVLVPFPFPRRDVYFLAFLARFCRSTPDLTHLPPLLFSTAFSRFGFPSSEISLSTLFFFRFPRVCFLSSRNFQCSLNGAHLRQRIGGMSTTRQQQLRRRSLFQFFPSVASVDGTTSITLRSDFLIFIPYFSHLLTNERSNPRPNNIFSLLPFDPDFYAFEGFLSHPDPPQSSINLSAPVFILTLIHPQHIDASDRQEPPY